MKKFLKKNKATLIVVGLVVLFVVLAILLKDVNFEGEGELQEWLADTASSNKVVTVIAQTSCGHCKVYKPVMTEVQEEYGFKLYWEEADLLSKSDYNILSTTYELTGYSGTPYTFVTENGGLIAAHPGRMEKEALISFLTDAGVIEAEES